MSQYPMYPSTQLSYLPAACTTPMYTYPANYMAMLPAMYGNGMTAGNMVQQQQQHPQQTVSPQAVVTGNTSLVDDNSQSKDSRETVTVSSSVSDNAGAPDNVSTVSDDRTEYIEELSREKEILEQKDNCHARRLIDREISLVQSGAANVPSSCETQMVDVYREKPIRLVVKVTVPVKEHPKFNFVGKLLGPKGNSLKRLQEETLTKMAVLGKGSMRDKAKEEEMRMSKDPKYQHLNDELHVEIVAFAPPAEAHARMSYALTEVRKYLIPDSNDTIRQLQMKELEILNSSEKMLSDPNMQLLKTVNAPLQSMQPLLVPSTSYLSSPHLSLLPTPPLDTPSATPTIAAPPTKYETEVGQSLESVVVSQDSSVSSRLKMTDSKRGDRRRDAQPY